jgi:hypothetical protein
MLEVYISLDVNKTTILQRWHEGNLALPTAEIGSEQERAGVPST